MTRGWLCGWGVDTRAFEACCRRHFPDEEPRVQSATLEGWRRLRGRCDGYGGFSLGAWLLLRAATVGELTAADVVLLAPFLAFPAEAGLGGRVRRVQLERVRRWLRSDPEAAVDDFARRAGLDLAMAKPAERDTLLEGLVWLESSELATVPPVARGWRVYAGRQDPLLELAAISTWPEAMVVEGAAHEAAALMAAAARERERERVA